jgi:protein tyrosine phosphatase
MKMNISRSSLSSSRDSDGPCLILHTASPLADSFEQTGDKTPLCNSAEIADIISLLAETHLQAPLFPETPITEIDSLSAPYEEWFKKINDETPLRKYPRTIASGFENKAKCRYGNVLPSDHNLVTLQTTSGFINANQFEKTILTQGPLVTTVADFWLLLFEKKITTTACLVSHMEPALDNSGRLSEKTYAYWDLSLQFDWQMPPGHLLLDTTINGKVFQVKSIGDDKILLSKEGSDELVIKRSFSLIFGEETHITNQLHYVDWPDFSICDPEMLLKFILQLEGEIVCHCSAGIGRSGVVAALRSLIETYNTTKQIPTIADVCTLIIAMRESRPGAITTASQLRLIIETLLAFIRTVTLD